MTLIIVTADVEVGEKAEKFCLAQGMPCIRFLTAYGLFSSLPKLQGALAWVVDFKALGVSECLAEILSAKTILAPRRFVGISFPAKLSKNIETWVSPKSCLFPDHKENLGWGNFSKWLGLDIAAPAVADEADLERLSFTMDRLLGSDFSREALQEWLESTIAYFKGVRASIILIDPHKENPTAVVLDGLDSKHRKRSSVLDQTIRLAHYPEILEVIEKGEPLYIDLAKGHPKNVVNKIPLHVRRTPFAQIVAPIKHRQKVIGVLTLRRDEQSFNEREMHLCSLLAGALGRYVQRRDFLRRLYKQLQTD